MCARVLGPEEVTEWLTSEVSSAGCKLAMGGGHRPPQTGGRTSNLVSYTCPWASLLLYSVA